MFICFRLLRQGEGELGAFAGGGEAEAAAVFLFNYLAAGGQAQAVALNPGAEVRGKNFSSKGTGDTMALITDGYHGLIFSVLQVYADTSPSFTGLGRVDYQIGDHPADICGLAFYIIPANIRQV